MSPPQSTQAAKSLDFPRVSGDEPTPRVLALVTCNIFPA